MGKPALCLCLVLAACASVREAPELGPGLEPSENDGTTGAGSGAAAATGPTEDDDARPDVGAQTPPEAPPSGSVLGPPDDPDRAIAITRSGETFFAVSASGEVVAQLPAFDGFEALRPHAYVDLQVRGDHLLLSRSECTEPSPSPIDPMPELTSCRHYAMLLRREGFELSWQRKSEPLAYEAVAHLGASGAVSIAESEPGSYAGRAVVIDSDGDEHAFAGVTPQSGPDADGFIAVLLDAASSPAEYGFIGPGSSAAQPLSVPRLPLGPAAQDALILASPQLDGDAAFTYLGVDDRGGTLLVHERPNEVARIALEAPAEGELELWPTPHAWMLVAFDRGDYSRRPWRSVTRDSHEVLTPSLPEAFTASVVSPPTGDWLRLSREDGAYGWLDASTGHWKPAPASPEGQRLFSTGDFCKSTDFVTEDGHAVVHLRDDVIGHAYLETDYGVLQALSAPIIDAVYVTTQRIGETFEIRPMPKNATYCPEPLWPTATPEGDLVRGGEVQYLRGGLSRVVDEQRGRAWLSPSGRFVAVLPFEGTPVLHDLEGGEGVTLSDMDSLEGWL
jgi:hypothetical protein